MAPFPDCEDDLRMNNPHQGSNATFSPLPDWDRCDLFCIHNYSSSDGRACGWRGRADEVPGDAACRPPVCPRCGHATLLPIRAMRQG